MRSEQCAWEGGGAVGPWRVARHRDAGKICLFLSYQWRSTTLPAWDCGAPRGGGLGGKHDKGRRTGLSTGTEKEGYCTKWAL